jgi:polyisoprenoid-binding protein YceI
MNMPAFSMLPTGALSLVLAFSLAAPWRTAQAAAPAVLPAAASATPPMARLVAGSEVTFTAHQIGVPLEGKFKRFDAQIALDPRHPQSGRVSFQIELGSVGINADTDSELLKPEWFNTAKFPKAQFTSRAIKAMGPGRFEVSGVMSIKGLARDVVVPVTLTAAGGQTTATGSFALKRLDFKIGDGDWADTSVVANDVQVRFKLLLQGLPPL